MKNTITGSVFTTGTKADDRQRLSHLIISKAGTEFDASEPNPIMHMAVVRCCFVDIEDRLNMPNIYAKFLDAQVLIIGPTGRVFSMLVF